MRSNSKIALLALTLSLAAAAPRAASLGEAVDRMSAAQFAALSDVPPVQLALLHEASELLVARRAGTLSARVADQALATILPQLRERRHLPNEPDTDAWRGVLWLHSEVVTRELRDIVRSGAMGENSALAPAVEDYLAAIDQFETMRPFAGAAGPDNPCFTNFALCLAYCARQDNFFARSLCALDCELDFAACMGNVVSQTVGSIRRFGPSF